MQKRYIAWALALLMVLSLTGCGSKAPTPTQPAATEVTNPPTAAPTQAPTETPTTIPPTEAPTEAPAETTAPAELDERALALGTWDGTTYSNTYAGIGFTLDETWTVRTVEELQQLPSIVDDMVEGTALEQAMEGVEQYTDILAENVDTLVTMNVLFQKQTMQQRLAYAMLSEEEILDATLSQKDVMAQAYGQAGINVESMEKVQVTFLGETHWALKTVAETQGVPYYILQVFDFHLGSYSMTITLASFVEDNTESLLELYYTVE